MTTSRRFIAIYQSVNGMTEFKVIRNGDKYVVISSLMRHKDKPTVLFESYFPTYILHDGNPNTRPRIDSPRPSLKKACSQFVDMVMRGSHEGVPISGKLAEDVLHYAKMYKLLRFVRKMKTAGRLPASGAAELLHGVLKDTIQEAQAKEIARHENYTEKMNVYFKELYSTEDYIYSAGEDDVSGEEYDRAFPMETSEGSHGRRKTKRTSARDGSMVSNKQAYDDERLLNLLLG